MTVADKFSILVLVFLMGAQLFKRSFLKRYVFISFVSSAAALFGIAFYSAFLQYESWRSSPLSVFLLPPYRNWDYFAYYAGLRIFSPLLIALAAAFVFKFAVDFLNSRFGERFLEKGESALFAFGIFLTGYPGFVFYVPSMLLSGFVLSAVYSVLKKGRAPFFYLWLPAAVFAILLKSMVPQALMAAFII